MFDRRLFETRGRKPRTPRGQSPSIFPLPALNGQPPVLLVFDPNDLGVELAYEKTPSGETGLVRSTTRESTLYEVPRLLPVFTVSDGRIIYARSHVDGYAILVAHPNGWATYYQRLRHMFAVATEQNRREIPVRGGDILGYAGPSRTGPLRPLRFELWRCNEDDDYEAVDPIRFMHRWRLERWNDARIKSVTPPSQPAA